MNCLQLFVASGKTAKRNIAIEECGLKEKGKLKLQNEKMGKRRCGLLIVDL